MTENTFEDHINKIFEELDESVDNSSLDESLSYVGTIVEIDLGMVYACRKPLELLSSIIERDTISILTVPGMLQYYIGVQMVLSYLNELIESNKPD